MIYLFIILVFVINGNSGLKTLDAGQKVEFEVTQSQKGPQATDVVVMK